MTKKRDKSRPVPMALNAAVCLWASRKRSLSYLWEQIMKTIYKSFLWALTENVLSTQVAVKGVA